MLISGINLNMTSLYHCVHHVHGVHLPHLHGSRVYQTTLRVETILKGKLGNCLNL